MKKMNRKQILTLTAALALTALTACSSLPASAASVDYDTAVKIAADHLGCDVSDLKVSSGTTTTASTSWISWWATSSTSTRSALPPAGAEGRAGPPRLGRPLR